MQRKFLHSPVIRVVCLFIVFVLVTFILGGFLLNGLLKIPSQIANCVVIVVILLISRAVYRKEGKNLSELGLNITLRNISFGITGILIGGIFVVALMYAVTFTKGYPVVYNPSFSLSYILNGLWLVFPTVILEELVFRGICYKKAVELSGVKKANLVFATVFILSHWINLGAFGNPALMTILLITGLGHVLYATAFLKSKTLYFPIGLHLGNNWISLFVFSSFNINDPAKEPAKPTLMRVMTNESIPVFNGQLILTTAITAIFFCAIYFGHP